MVGTGPSGTALVRIETEWQDWTGSARTGRDGFVMEWQERCVRERIGPEGTGSKRNGRIGMASLGSVREGSGRRGAERSGRLG